MGSLTLITGGAGFVGSNAAADMARRGERVRIRLGNLGPMDHHPIHIHGLWFHVTATDGGYVPVSAQ